MREALLHPETVDRLKAVRRFVETPGAAFPPAPGAAEGVQVPPPVCGWIPMGLEWWKQRRINVVTWDALDMLFPASAARHYREDQFQYEGPRLREEARQLAESSSAAGGSSGGGSS